MTERNIRRQFVERDLSRGFYNRTSRIIFAGDTKEQAERTDNKERITEGQEVTVSDLIDNIEVNVDRARGRRTRGRGRKVYPKQT